MLKKTHPLLITFFLITCSRPPEFLRVPALFSDGMILQRDTTVTVWGQSLPLSNVQLYPSWSPVVTTKSDSNGNWKIQCLTTKDHNTHTLTIKSGKEKIDIKNILMGEVWLASGQSNMEMNFDYCCNTTDSSEQVLSNDIFNNIRMFNVKKDYQLNPSSSIKGRWVHAIKDSIKTFSAVGYFFAKNLHNSLNIPVGIIHSSWGGSDIESWISKNALSSIKDFGKRLSSKENINMAKNSEEWFSKLKKVDMPSAGFDLLLGTYFDKSDTSVGYLDYFLEAWQQIDFEDEHEILTTENYNNWPQLDLPGSLKNIYGLNDFNGVTILKNEFFVDSITNIYKIDMGEVSLGWAGELREYDFYVNGKKIGSTFGEDNSNYFVKLREDYRKHYRTYPFKYRLSFMIPSQNIKVGRNEITIRVIGSGEMNPIKVLSGNFEIEMQNKWKYKASAEIYKQMDDFRYPYMSFYLYNNSNLDIADRPPKVSYNYNEPSNLYNGMISPLIPYTMKGVIWYQGENNAFRHEEYGDLFSLLISDWRSKWGSTFPFYYVQIAPYFNYYGSNAPLRDVQRKASRIPKTGMAVTLDIGEKYDIHPSNKHDVGSRLARYALKNDYNKDLIESGPLFRYLSVHEGVAKVFFNNIAGGLVLDQGKFSEFEIAGLDKKYFRADVINLNDHLELYSRKVLSPVYVRYAWSDTSSASLFNSEGLPASSFKFENE